MAEDAEIREALFLLSYRNRMTSVIQQIQNSGATGADRWGGLERIRNFVPQNAKAEFDAAYEAASTDFDAEIKAGALDRSTVKAQAAVAAAVAAAVEGSRQASPHGRRSAAKEEDFDTALGKILVEEIKANPKVKEILAKAQTEKKSLMELMFTVHVQESLSAVLAAIGTSQIHMSEDQHDRWKTVAADKNYTAGKIQPRVPYSERPNTAFDQLLTIAKTDLALPRGTTLDETEYKNVHAALQQLKMGEEY
jgi:hypothetical protein